MVRGAGAAGDRGRAEGRGPFRSAVRGTRGGAAPYPSSPLEGGRRIAGDQRAGDRRIGRFRKEDDARHAKADGKSRSASRSSKATKRHDDDADQAEPRRTRVRRRTAMFSSREDASPAVPGEPSDDDLGVDTGTDIIVRDDSADLSRALDVVSTLPQPAPRAHAMTSVLFQEPVLPVPEIVRDAHDDDREDDDRDSRGGGKSRRSRNGRVST